MVGSIFVKTVHVELAYKGVHFVMAEVFREHDLLEFVGILDDEFLARWGPKCNFGKLLVLAKTQLTWKISKILEMKPATSQD